MKTLFDLIQPIPADRTAIILPDSNLRVSYGAFRDQIQAVAEALAGAGIRRGDRVGIALPNGLPMVVSFFAAAMAGTAAPLNPGYKEHGLRRVPRTSAPAAGRPASRREVRHAPAPQSTRGAPGSCHPATCTQLATRRARSSMPFPSFVMRVAHQR
jgi:acyl-CoA synthetase (AMP-forming)/AMP-acid ligase II